MTGHLLALAPRQMAPCTLCLGSFVWSDTKAKAGSYRQNQPYRTVFQYRRFDLRGRNRRCCFKEMISATRSEIHVVFCTYPRANRHHKALFMRNQEDFSMRQLAFRFGGTGLPVGKIA